MSGRHPYPWCTWNERDNLDDEGKWEARGALHHKEVYEHFVNDFGGLKEKSKQCKGVEKPTVFDGTGITPNDMSLFNFPESHLMLGVGQKLHDMTLHSMSTSESEVHEIALKKFNIMKRNIMEEISKEIQCVHR